MFDVIQEAFKRGIEIDAGDTVDSLRQLIHIYEWQAALTPPLEGLQHAWEEGDKANLISVNQK